MLEVFEAMCASSEDSSGREDGVLFSKKHGERVRQYLLCDTCDKGCLNRGTMLATSMAFVVVEKMSNNRMTIANPLPNLKQQ